MNALARKFLSSHMAVACWLALAISVSLPGCAPTGPSDQPKTAGYHIPVSLRNVSGLTDLAHESVVIRNIEEANSTNVLSQEEIERVDRDWRNAGPDGTDIIRKVLENPASDRLREARMQNPTWLEIFLIDEKGCATAANMRTTDYWQGDEKKWTRIFLDKQSEYFIDEIEYDESTHAYVHHYSIPITSEQGQLIGVLVAGVADVR